MLNVIVIGLGPIGIAAARAVDRDAGMSLVGLVDVDPAKLGRSLDELDELDRASAAVKSAARVVNDFREIENVHVAIVCTTSKFDGLAPLLRDLIERRIHVVSSCEEMAFPAYRHPALSREIHALAKQQNVALLGTGVNPGFVMDLLPVVLSSMMTRVESVRCVRRVNASTRRKPLQAKVGATMSVARFNALKATRAIGHQGIAESVAMIAAGLGRSCTAGSVREELEPVLADRAIDSLVGEIQPGQVCGMRNTARWSSDGLSIELDLTMAVGLDDAHDAIELGGSTPLALRIANSTPGDTATVAALLNCARAIAHSPAGLHTMLTLPNVGSR